MTKKISFALESGIEKTEQFFIFSFQVEKRGVKFSVATRNQEDPTEYVEMLNFSEQKNSVQNSAGPFSEYEHKKKVAPSGSYCSQQDQFHPIPGCSLGPEMHAITQTPSG